MATDTKQNLKTLRVDNWAVFFLQRLQLMFAKGDCCDLTLKFHTGQELKVHRLVLITCTTFFESMEKEGNVINMPENLPYSVVQPIINFLYSGKLEFKSELHGQLLTTSKNLNITILSKLLVTQKNDNGLAAALAKPGETKKPQRTFLATRIGPAPIGGLGGRKLPIWRQRSLPLYRPDRNRVIKDEEPKPMRFEWPEGKEPTDSLLLTSPSFTPLSYKSEPVFTPANPPLILSSQSEASPSSPLGTSLKRRAPWPSNVPDKVFKDDKKDEILKEVKKEAPIDPGGDFSDDDDGHFETIHSYGDSDDEQEAPVRPAPPEPVVKTPPAPQPQQPPPRLQTYRPATKAQQVQPLVSNVQERFEPAAEPTPTIATSSTITPTPKPILKQTEPQLGQTPSKKVRFSIAADDEKCNPTPQPGVPEKVSSSSLTSDVVFESQSVPSPPTTNAATDQGASLPSELVDLTADPPPPTSNVPAHTATPPKSETIQTYSKAMPRKEKKTFSPADSANHAKIIAEVLKKYPDLVKNNKNIRLKISAPGSSSITNTLTLDTKRAAGKAYVVVKSSVKTEPPTTPKTETPSSSAMSLMAQRPITLPPQPSVAGPWICSTCDNEGGAIKFSSYYEYRKHFQDVHNEKFDSKTCEYCGYKTSKRSLYLYHLFTKHNVAPPKNIAFPKCDQCGYIALSDGLLQKHVSSHKPIKKDWPCPRCEVVFDTYNGLQTHMATCRGSRSKTCPLCQVSFASEAVYSDHVKICGENKTITTPETSTENTIGIYEEPGPQPEQAVEMIEVPIMNTDALTGKSGHTYVQLPSGLILTDGNSVLLPSAEGDDLNAVGTSIGGPMGLTVALPQDQHVILLDANSEFFIQGNDQVIVRRLNPVNSTEEYIVPEVLDESMQQIYTAQGIPYSVATTAGNMVACPVVPMQSSSQSLDKQEDSGNTVVRVHDHVDPHELNMQHHIGANEMESIIVSDNSSNDVAQSRLSTDNQEDVYVEEPQDVVPQQQQNHMAINKELMDVVAMEVQHTPIIENSSVVLGLPEIQAQSEAVLRRPEREVIVTSESSYVSSSMGILPEGTVLGQIDVVQEVPVSSASDALQNPVEDSQLAEEPSRTEDRPQSPAVAEDGEKVAKQAAKVDSLVKDWGFDNEEEAGDVVNDDSDSEEGGARTGPSRVTVEL